MTTKSECLANAIAALKEALPVGFNQERILYPNAPFNTPTPVTSPANPIADAWLEVRMADVGVRQESQCKEITAGLLSVDIYWPKMTGNTEALSMAGAIKKHLSNTWLGALKINLGLIDEFGNKDWYNVNISFDYFYEDEVK